MKAVLRADMSDWVLHFIHDRNPEYEPFSADLSGEEDSLYMPAHADGSIDKRFREFYEWEAEYENLESNASAFQVLMKILDQGMLKSGWSFRGGKATVYGPKSAVCFTEMPLSSLVAYAKERGDANAVATYAVGLLKSEVYAAGGRPVIYGLSRHHKEVSGDSWPRFLAGECGIGEVEQYRYVALKLGADPQIDWTHEREWRWADHDNRINVPGLPIWRHDEQIRFTRALVLVQNEEEAKEVLSYLRRLLDAGCDKVGHPYDKPLLKSTVVVSLEQLEKADLLRPDAALTIEQIPHHLLQPIPTTIASDEAKNLARRIISEALQAAAAAAEEWRKGGDRDVAGFAELVIEDGLVEFTRAGLELGLLKPFSGTSPFGSGGYWVDGILTVCKTQSLGEHEAAAEAAKKRIERDLPTLSMHVWSRWD